MGSQSKGHRGGAAVGEAIQAVLGAMRATIGEEMGAVLGQIWGQCWGGEGDSQMDSDMEHSAAHFILVCLTRSTAASGAADSKGNFQQLLLEHLDGDPGSKLPW